MFKDDINELVSNRTGFDIPQLSGKLELSRKEVLEHLRWQQRWFEDYATDCVHAIDRIIADNFTMDERLGD